MTTLTKGILIAFVAVVLIWFVVIGVAVGVVLYQWKYAVRNANEKVAVQNLNTISIRQIQYYTENANYATFDQLIEKGFLDHRFAGAAPTVDGYIYVLRVMPPRAGQKASFALNADPESATAGTKHFFINDTSSTIHVKSDQPASAEDPALVR